MSTIDETLSDENTGLVYLSYIPEGMTPASLRQLMSNYAELGRIYLAPYSNDQNVNNSGDASKLLNANKKRRKNEEEGSKNKKLRIGELWTAKTFNFWRKSVFWCQITPFFRHLQFGSLQRRLGRIH